MQTTPISLDKLDVFKAKAISWLTDYTPKVVGAILLLIIGLWIINRVIKLVEHSMKRHLYDVSLQSFILSLLTIGLRVMLIISVAGMVGIETTSFLAVFGTIGLGIGLALQGSLANFAGGVLILIFKPFKLGDIIEAQSQTGLVKKIGIFSTMLETPAHKSIIIPNGILSNGIIVNLTALGYTVSEIKLEVDESTPIVDLRHRLFAMLDADAKILKTPSPSFFVIEFVPKLMVSLSFFTSPADQLSVSSDIKDQILTMFASKVILAPIQHLTIDKAE